MNFNYREELKSLFKERKLKNSSYSLRAFARDLGVSSTALSDVMSSKRNLSKKNAQKVAQKLCFSPREYREMLLDIKQKITNTEFENEVLQIKEDEFNAISHWYYLAILTLSQQKNILANSIEIGKRIGVDKAKVEDAINTLRRLKLVKIEKGVLKRTSLPLRTTTDVPSYAIRNYHKENLEVIKFNIDHRDVHLREVTSMNLNFDPKKIKIAKKMINDFKEKFTKEMEKTEEKEVYTLAMHFFPASLSSSFEEDKSKGEN